MHDDVTEDCSPALNSAAHPEPDPIDIAVIGAGAIGGSIAARLDAVGHQVTVTARGAHLEAIRASGLRLTGALSEHTARVTAELTLHRRPTLAIVTTKAQDAPAAIAANERWLRDTTVLVVQNGLNGARDARAALPHAHVLSGTTSIGANVPEPGHIEVTTPGATLVGALNSAEQSTAAALVSLLQPAVPAELCPDTQGVLWSKLMVNQVNALPAITGLPIQATIADPRLRRVLTLSLREGVQVARAHGVHFAAVQALNDALLSVLAEAPLATAEFVPLLMAHNMGGTPNTGSTLQSVRTGRPTEIDYLNGAVVQAAEEVGLQAPVNAALVQLVHEVERSAETSVPAFLSPEAVASDARLASYVQL